jgi:conjugal transfer ATP-binding protein TraC
MGLFSKKSKKQSLQAPVSANVKGPGLRKLEKGMVSLVDVIAPASIEVDFKYIRVDDVYYRTIFVIGYPRYVSPNWLQPLIDFDHSMNTSMFVYPTSASDALTDLRRKIAEMEATISSEIEDGKVVDPKVRAALDDALSIQEQLAKGVERFFQFSLYITLFSDNLDDLNEASKRLVTTLNSIMMITKNATLQMEDGFKSTIPIAQDRLFITRNMDTTSLASTFPFTSATLTQDRGVMYGINEQNGSLVIFDRYSLENSNEVILGKSGSGKSYLIKLEAMRQFMFGTEVLIVDPEGEYGMLAKTLGGELVSFTPSDPVKINPFDLSGLYEEGENELGLKILSLHGLLKIIMGTLDPAHDAILDRALVETYRQKGITADPATQKKQPPLMEDLYKVLLGTEDPAARELALRLEKFIKGSLSGIFNQQSNFDIKNPFTVFDIKTLEEELRPVAMHIVLDFIWTKVKRSLKKRLLILDEAWYIMKYPDSASFVYSIAKRSRKYYLALTTATQDVQDFLSTDYGKAVLSNSSLQILLKQSTTEIDHIAQVFYLSQGEKELLLSADIGEGLFFAGQSHVAIKVIAAPFEHTIITSNPQDLEKMKQEQPTTTAAGENESTKEQTATTGNNL